MELDTQFVIVYLEKYIEQLKKKTISCEASIQPIAGMSVRPHTNQAEKQCNSIAKQIH